MNHNNRTDRSAGRISDGKFQIRGTAGSLIIFRVPTAINHGIAPAGQRSGRRMRQTNAARKFNAQNASV